MLIPAAVVVVQARLVQTQVAVLVETEALDQIQLCLVLLLLMPVAAVVKAEPLHLLKAREVLVEEETQDLAGAV